jgi:hypothetical protein
MEVLVPVQHDEACALRDGRDEEIGHRRRSMATIGKQAEQLAGAVLGGGAAYSTGILSSSII